MLTTSNKRSLTAKSFAKVNLGLRVLDKRADGFHDIESIFIAINLADTVTVEQSEKLLVTCVPEVTQSVEDNLVYKAAVLLSDTMSQTQPLSAKITVQKSIPTGAGLGGGSSNAAVTLLLLFELWTSKPPTESEIDEILFPIALSLGSDIPFFLRPGISYVTGRGENVSLLPIDLTWHLLVILPGIYVNTGWAYAQLDVTVAKVAARLDQQLLASSGDVSVLSDEFGNDFEAAVMLEYPVLSDIKNQLKGAGATFVSMSGTGSTMYGIFTSAATAESAQSLCPEWSTYICSPVRTQKPQ